ncbi:MAG: response regulator, partial [Pseudomonadota bacterium]|nr:response regulator [Pseudomonadota bacterium]MDP2354109.1 response regulator [Pseudomonadota bacterium]
KVRAWRLVGIKKLTADRCCFVFVKLLVPNIENKSFKCTLFLTWVDWAKEGQGGIAMVERLRPDAVCLDVNMPGISGLDTLKILREKYPEVRVVMITGDASMATVREAVSFGAVGYIIKPFNAGRVADTLRAAFRPEGDSIFS